MTTEEQWLDAAFVPLGFTAQHKSATALEHRYTATRPGWPLDIYIVGMTRRRTVGPASSVSYGGHRIELVAGARLKTRLVFGRTSDFGLRPVELPGEPFGEWRLYALDERWARDFVGDREIESALRTLLPDDRRYFVGVFFLEIKAETTKLYVDVALESITPDNARRWVGAFNSLVDAATRLPPTSKPVEASAWERFTNRNRRLMTWLVLGALAAALALLIVGAMACGALLIYLDSAR